MEVRKVQALLVQSSINLPPLLTQASSEKKNTKCQQPLLLKPRFGQSFGEGVCNHLICCNVGSLDFCVLDMLPDSMFFAPQVSQSATKHRVLSKSKGAVVVTIEHGVCVRWEAKLLQQLAEEEIVSLAKE